MDLLTLVQIITAIVTMFSAIFAGISVYLLYKTLKDEHEWRRRQYTADLLSKWNDNVLASYQVIEKHFPHVRFPDKKTGGVSEITKVQARDVYTAKPTDKAYWELRIHIVRLLNFFEYLTTAYEQEIVDKEAFETSLKESIITWVSILKNFIEIVIEYDKRDKWEQLNGVINEWKRVNKSPRKKTG